jgi:ATP-dependent Lon protease
LIELRRQHEHTETESTADPLPADALIVVPVRNLVLFPGVDRAAHARARGVHGSPRRRPCDAEAIGLVLQRNAEVRTARVHGPVYRRHDRPRSCATVTTPDGAHNLVVQGDQRFRVAEFLEGVRTKGRPRGSSCPTRRPVNRDIEARMLQVKARAAELLELLPRAPGRARRRRSSRSSRRADSADFVAEPHRHQGRREAGLLETFDVQMRLDACSPSS